MGTSESRTYKSERRAAQAAQTRQRILDAVPEVLVEGLSALTMPAVAKAAGVSLPTVYRYFPDKKALTDAAAEQIRARAGVQTSTEHSLESLITQLKTVFANIPEHSDGFRVLTAAAASSPMDPDRADERRSLLEKGLREDLRGLRGRDRTYFVDTALTLCSSSTASSFARFGFGTDDAAHRVEWILETLLLGMRARQEQRAEKKGKTA